MSVKSTAALQAEFDDQYGDVLMYLGQMADVFEQKATRLREQVEALRKAREEGKPMGFLESYVSTAVFHAVNNSSWVSAAEMATMMGARAARTRSHLARTAHEEN